ncbi:MAG: PAS domain S-box protein [Actinomycetota bacterium]|nr:PAS domain S-box protein [Actinomycetota bacterium]
MSEKSFSQLVVVGSSAGGIEALSTLVSTLPEDFPAPIVVAQHLDPERESNLENILSRRSTLPVRTVADEEPLEPGVVFVVPANRHVNITDSEIGLHVDSAGRPKPSVDLLMSTAAEVFGEHLVAVVLTGTGSDGTNGARLVSKAGGTVVIQNPETAEFGDMPGSLAPNTVDIVADLDEIGQFLERRKAEEERDRALVREREARQRATGILKSINDAFFVLDKKRRFTYANDRAVDLTGRSREELLGKSVLEAFPELADGAASAELIWAEEKRNATQFEHYYPRLDRWLHYRVYPSSAGLSVYATDITEQKKAEEALRAREEQYRTIFELAGVGKGQADLETGRLLRVNRRLCEITGYEPEELLTRTFAEITHPEDLDREYYSFERMVRGEIDEYEIEKRYVRKDGAVVWVRVNATAIRDPEGQPLRAVATIEDITERKQAEEALRKSEERYKALYEDNPFMYFTVDTRGTLLSVNRSGAEQLGYTVEDLVGRTFVDLFHEEDKEDISWYFSACLQDLERPSSWEARKVRRDGSTLWVRENVRIVRNLNGDTVVLLICEDITERKQAEEALQYQLDLTTTITNNAADSLFLWDTEGRVTFMNPAAEQTFGWRQEELLGEVLHARIHHHYPDGRPYPVSECPLVRVFESGQTLRDHEDLFFHRDGSPVPVACSLAPIVVDGKTTGVALVVRDITERKRVEEEWERSLTRELELRAQAEERRRISRELHDRVAHSMGVVHQSLELHGALKESDPEKARSKMELAREMAKEALNSTRNLSMELRQREVPRGLEAALTDLLGDVVPPAVRPDLLVEGDEALVPPDTRNQLFLILREAVRNAVAHSGCERIKVRLSITPQRAFATVEDDGRGFDPEGARSGGGLRSMRERTSLLGAAFKLSSAPGAGTKVEASIPLVRTEERDETGHNGEPRG